MEIAQTYPEAVIPTVIVCKQDAFHLTAYL